MIYILIIVATIVAFILCFTVDSRKYEGRHMICVMACTILSLGFMVSSGALIEKSVTRNALIERNQVIYDSLIYQLDNNLYDNDNDVGKKQLYTEIQNWNSDLATGKSMMNNFWVGIFCHDFYEHFEFIEISDD